MSDGRSSLVNARLCELDNCSYTCTNAKPSVLPEMIGFNVAWIKLGASVTIVAPVIAYIVLSSPVHKPVTPARKALRSAHIEQLITWQFEYNVHCKVRASTMSTVSLQLIISCQLRM